MLIKFSKQDPTPTPPPGDDDASASEPCRLHFRYPPLFPVANDYSSLAQDCGITHNTAKEWLSLLETSCIIVLIRAHHKNFNKRLVKMPKLYFTDPGLAVHLAGIQSPDNLCYHSLKEGFFESLIVTEFLKYRFNQAKEANLYFWRDQHGHEIDCLIEHRGRDLIPVEVTSGRTANNDYFKEIAYWIPYRGTLLTGRLWYMEGISHSSAPPVI
jgi:predicted AAA+ superfamily ATPase